jgi:hypothetical protein
MIIREQFDRNRIFIKNTLLHAEVVYDKLSNKYCFKNQAIESISKEFQDITIYTNNGCVVINFIDEESAAEAYKIAIEFINNKEESNE